MRGLKREFSVKLAAVSVVLLAASILAPSVSQASTATNVRILAVRLNAGATPARVSVRVGPHGSSCPTGEWFAYENADTGLRLLWTQALIAAVTQNKRVTIQGNNSCDGFGVEGITDIDVLR